MISLRKLVFITIILAFVVVALGAFTRLTHAGLGCPDWPGCYGFLDVPKTAEEVKQAEMAFPDRPVEPQKAWNEMIHRYFAGTLGLFILAIAFLSVKNRQPNTPVKLPLFLLALVTFQAALGMWTVTLMLMPVVVMGHLLGGFATLSLLFLLYLRLSDIRIPSGDVQLRRYGKWAVLGIIILTVQIALGGWTSSHYAALVCTELPICQAGWMDQAQIGNAFDLIPPKRDTYELGFLTHPERLAVHISHRFGAIVTSIYLMWLSLAVLKNAQSQTMKSASILVMLLLVVQVSLGVSNIVFVLPLAVAVAHNVVAVTLMVALIRLTYLLKRKV